MCRALCRGSAMGASRVVTAAGRDPTAGEGW